MDFSLRMLGSDSDNLFNKFQTIMSDYFWVYARAAIVHTRCYTEGIRFVDRLSTLNDKFYSTQRFTKEEYEKYDHKLSEFKLVLLDRSDLWFDYIQYFEQYRMEKSYVLKYSRGDPLLPRGDPVIVDYVIKEDYKFKYVHFLYTHHHRYELIKTKMKKLRQGKRVGNLYHKQKSELADEEIERRFRDIIYRAEHGIPVYITM